MNAEAKLMKSVRIHQYGSLETAILEEVSVPEIGLADVLVQIDAASINPLDLKLIGGTLQEHFPLSVPYSLGTDLAGTVVQTGPLAVRWKKGDRVFARLEPAPGPGSDYSRGGAFAEFASVPAKHLASAPANLSLDEAAGLPTGAGAAWQVLFETAHLQPGQTVLIHGGSGGVGSFAVQLAKYIGAHVIATTSKNNAEIVRELGADEIIDYENQDFATIVSNIDVVLDTVGGVAHSKSYRVIKPEGVLVSIATFPDLELAKAHRVSATWMLHLSDATRLSLIAGLCDAGALKIPVDSTFELRDFATALKRSASGRAKGKILLKVR
jgi:NADPH:quinone reductase-like Zn-dependent oxidoreductase